MVDHKPGVCTVTHSDVLATALAPARHLFFDFDGPICSIFAKYAAPRIADELRTLLNDIGVPISGIMRSTDDPLEVVRQTGTLGNQQWTTQIANALRDAETQAAATAEPTAGFKEVLAAADLTDRRCSVVSNNSVQAITMYLRLHGLEGRFVAVVGRYDGMPTNRLKPNPHLLSLALAKSSANPDTTVMIGDSVTDVKAANELGMTSIGYSRMADRRQELVQAGAVEAVSAMDELAEVIRHHRLRCEPIEP
jgi:HAD superfamily hydrolase (TIGR01549 family)